MRPSPRRRHAPRGLLGLGLVVLALLTLVCAPLSAGPAHAGMRDCMSPAPAAAGPKTPGRTRDTTCAAACALGGQLVAARIEAPPAPRRPAAPVVYARLDRRPAGTSPEDATPPPR